MRSLAHRTGVYDLEIIDEVTRLDPYRLRQFVLPASPTVVDIGAHIGAFTVFCAELHPDARIVAVEMDRENHALLTRNIRSLPGVTALHAAVIGAERPLAYRRGGTNSGGNRVVWNDEHGAAELPEVLTLAEVLTQAGLDHVDLLKLDCEGCEHGILRQAAVDGSLAKVRYLAAEYHEFFGETLVGLQQTLAAAGHIVTVVPICSISGIIFGVRP